MRSLTKGYVVAVLTALGFAVVAVPAQAEGSADGERIVFVASPGDLRTMRPDGTDIQDLGTVGSSPRWSPDGRSVAFSRESGIFIVDSDGGNYRKLPGSAAGETQPAWSPDGTSIAVVRVIGSNLRQLWIRRVDGSGGIAVQTDEAALAGPLTWSPDGKRILHNHEGGQGPMVSVAVDGSGEQVVATGYDGKWSPDGRRIVYVVGQRFLFVSNADGSNLKLVRQGPPSPATLSRPAFSPDGQQIVYEQAAPASRLRVIDTDGTDDHQLLDQKVYAADWHRVRLPQ